MAYNQTNTSIIKKNVTIRTIGYYIYFCYNFTVIHYYYLLYNHLISKKVVIIF